MNVRLTKVTLYLSLITISCTLLYLCRGTGEGILFILLPSNNALKALHSFWALLEEGFGRSIALWDFVGRNEELRLHSK